MPEKFRYFCMGNALVVPLIAKMEKKIEKIFVDEP
jgi:DNA (cytosine-5)-methyltransferase 1